MNRRSNNAQQSMPFQVHAIGEVQIFTVSVPRLFDPALVDQLDTGLRELLATHNRVVVNLSHVHFIPTLWEKNPRL